MTTSNWYVARPSSVTEGGIKIAARCESKTLAGITAKTLYANGAIAPIVVAAPNITAARDKARRCLVLGQLTTRQTANPKVA